MYWKMYADYRKEHIITTGMCTPRLAEIAHCEIRNLQKYKCDQPGKTEFLVAPLDNGHFITGVLSNSIGWERSQAERTINLINPEIPEAALRKNLRAALRNFF